MGAQQSAGLRPAHGGKVKNDRIDSEKIAQLLRSGMLPEAYAYPEAMRSTQDLPRRRMYLVRPQAELQGHIQNTRHLYILPAFEKRVGGRNNKIGNAHLKWALGEVAYLFLRESDQAKAWH